MADNRSRRRAPDAAAPAVVMRHPDGTGCNWRGQSFAPDVKGAVTVPAAAAPDLIGHGFDFVTE